MSKLVQQLNEFGIYPQEWRSAEDVNQTSIDAVASKLEETLSEEDIASHTVQAYSNSTQAYQKKSVNTKVIPQICDFMNELKADDLVLDLGCAHGRDTLYFTTPSQHEVLGPGIKAPDYSLRCVAFDGAREFLDMTYNSLKEHDSLDRVPLVIKSSFDRQSETEVIHSLNPDLEEALMKKSGRVFDGIWACASLLIHIPPTELTPILKSWTSHLAPQGVFAGSYIRAEQSGRKFLASRSAPGEIKVFTHFSDEDMQRAFSSCNLSPVDLSNSSYTGHGYTQEGFFGNVLYRKE